MSGGLREVRVPDIGDFTDVEIIEVLVGAGDTVGENDPLVTLETDKAAMDVPSPAAGRVAEAVPRGVLSDREQDVAHGLLDLVEVEHGSPGVGAGWRRRRRSRVTVAAHQRRHGCNGEQERARGAGAAPKRTRRLAHCG